MKKNHIASCLLLGLCAWGLQVQAGSLADGLGKKLSAGGASQLAVPGLMGSSSAGNAAGVISYCMKNKYLNVDQATQVKNQLLGKMGLNAQEEPKDEGYLSGLSGMVMGGDGKSLSIDKLKGDLKDKACDFVLDNAKSLL